MSTMKMFNDSLVQEYMSSLCGKNPIYSVAILFRCRCIDKDAPDGSAHSPTAKPLSENLAELAASQGPENLNSVVMFLNVNTHLHGDTMRLLVHKMLESKEIHIVNNYYSVLDNNFALHPPCAPYMETVYKELMLVPYRRYFEEMTLWDFLVNSFKKITSGDHMYGDNAVADYAFKKCLNFCVNVLLLDFEVCCMNNGNPLIGQCLNYDPRRRTRLSEITKLLDMMFNTGYDLQASIIDLAYLVDRLKK